MISAVASPAVPGPAPSIRFLATALCWNLILFALLRLPGVQTGLLVPLARTQLTAALALFGSGNQGVEPAAECSGADAIALCLATILAFPTSRRRRIAGAALGVLLLLAFNVLRIASLAHAAGTPERFERLHLWVWPALLVTGASLYVLAWMRRAGAPQEPPTLPAAGRFVALSGVALLVFLGITPWLHAWPPMLALAASEAAAAATLLGYAGVPAQAVGGVLVTSRGVFQVTSECLATPLLPVALAALFAFTSRLSARLIGLAVALPVFAALGTLRLLLLAAPPALLAAPETAAHAFFQVAAGVALVVATALRAPAAPRRMALGLRVLAATAGGTLLAALVWPLGSRLPRWIAVHAIGLAPPADAQGALALLPAFQLGLFLALLVGGGRSFPLPSLLGRLGALGASMGVLLALAASLEGLPVLLVRALALALPWLLAVRLPEPPPAARSLAADPRPPRTIDA